jgi:hypothetical protein
MVPIFNPGRKHNAVGTQYTHFLTNGAPFDPEDPGEVKVPTLTQPFKEIVLIRVLIFPFYFRPKNGGPPTAPQPGQENAHIFQESRAQAHSFIKYRAPTVKRQFRETVYIFGRT